jgi:hypothetical protein
LTKSLIILKTTHKRENQINFQTYQRLVKHLRPPVLFGNKKYAIVDLTFLNNGKYSCNVVYHTRALLNNETVIAQTANSRRLVEDIKLLNYFRISVYYVCSMHT